MRFPRMTSRRILLVITIIALLLSAIELFPANSTFIWFIMASIAGMFWVGTSRARLRLGYLIGAMIGAALGACMFNIYFLVKLLLDLKANILTKGEIFATMVATLFLVTELGAIIGTVFEVVLMMASSARAYLRKRVSP